jgi:hypothetical protein
MDKPLKSQDCEMTSLQTSKVDSKPTVEYFGELGQHGEFEGGLMESWEHDSSATVIITSKEDVYNHILSKKQSKIIKNSEKNSSQACHQCLIH